MVPVEKNVCFFNYRNSHSLKRKIYAAFLDWELPQKVLDQFKKRSINDNSFDLYVDQMYGPLTTARRNLAFECRKKLKEQGAITSGYVAFPAKLMINSVGDYDRNGKKIYKVHGNFSSEKVVIDRRRR